MASYESSIIQQQRNTTGSESSYEEKKMIDKLGPTANSQRARYQFQLDVDIRRIGEKPIFHGFGKSIYEAQWINQNSLPIVLLEIDGANIKQEASFYVELSFHPHIVRTYGLVQSDSDSVVLVQERALQGTLFELLSENEFQPSERVLWDIFEQICDAMIFLTDKDIIHGDLACRSVLVFQMNPINPKKNLVKLTDFGFTRFSKLYSIIGDSASTTTITIPTRYAAPELLKNSKKSDYSEKSDVYSMGVLMWEACSYGKLPYPSMDDEAIRQLKLKDKRLTQPSLCSDQLWTIINQCWDKKPKKRPNFQSLKQSISDLQPKPTVKSEWEIIPDANLEPSVLSSQLNKVDNLIGHEDCREQNDGSEISERKYERCYGDEDGLGLHQTTNFQNGSTSCPFCQEYLPSSTDAHDHLIQCGTKTDQCPNCQQFIQRAIFAYHYENNCADIDEIEISSGLNNSRSNNSSQFPPGRSKGKTQSTIPNIPQSRIDKRSSSKEFIVIPCEYCQEQCSAEQLRLHEMSCPRNPNARLSSARPTQKRPSVSPKLDNDTTPLVADEASDVLVRDPKSPSVNGHTDENTNERYCCCCS